MSHDPDDGPEPRRNTRPDWLTGAEEAFDAPQGAERPMAPRPLPKPEGLVHRELPQARSEGPPPLGSPPVAEPDTGKPTLKAWTARASSIPTLRREDAAADESEPAPVEAEAHAPDLPVDSPALERLVEATARPAATPRAMLKAAPQATWWEHALTHLMTDRRLQIALVVLGGVVALAMVSSGVNHVTTQHLADMREHPDRWDGQLVTVDGRVGEVFPVADGWTFYLHQGRDTIVAFAKTQQPVERQKIRFHGRVSTGFMDGVARQALFEEKPQER